MNHLHIEYKRETGLQPSPPESLVCDCCGEGLDDNEYFTSEYVEWLEDKLNKAQIENKLNESK